MGIENNFFEVEGILLENGAALYSGAESPDDPPLNLPTGSIYLRTNGDVWSKSTNAWTLIGGSGPGGGAFDQSLNTTDEVTFAGLTLTSNTIGLGNNADSLQIPTGSAIAVGRGAGSTSTTTTVTSHADYPAGETGIQIEPITPFPYENWTTNSFFIAPGFAALPAWTRVHFYSNNYVSFQNDQNEWVSTTAAISAGTQIPIIVNAQKTGSIAVGDFAGRGVQGVSSIAIGDHAASDDAQYDTSIAIGSEAGRHGQKWGALAVGQAAGGGRPLDVVVTADAAAGDTTVQVLTAHARELAGKYVTSSYLASDCKILQPDGVDGPTIQFIDALTYVPVALTTSIAAGATLGVAQGLQGMEAVAVGSGAGARGQADEAIAIGPYAGNEYQGFGSIAVGLVTGSYAQGERSVAIGVESAEVSQGDNSVAVGTSSGRVNQGMDAIAIGDWAGMNHQGTNAVAVGSEAAEAGQAAQAVAVGRNAGLYMQGQSAVALGVDAAWGDILWYAHNGLQATDTVLTGLESTAGIKPGYRLIDYDYAPPKFDPTVYVVSVDSETQVTLNKPLGYDSWWSISFIGGGQGASAIAIGEAAGVNNQGAAAIAIGKSAGDLNQPANSIMLNASGVALNGDNAGLYVNPVRSDAASTTQALYYNPTTKEITYTAPTGGGGSGLYIGTTPPADTSLLWLDESDPNGVGVYGIPGGGTTGQVLVKSSSNNYDVAWGAAGGGESISPFLLMGA